MDILQNLTVLSLEQATVLPYLTFRLAQDGVRIIRLEHPVYGDPNRLIGENVLGEERMNSYYLCINGGKEALTLNLAEPEGQDLLHSQHWLPLQNPNLLNHRCIHYYRHQFR